MVSILERVTFIVCCGLCIKGLSLLFVLWWSLSYILFVIFSAAYLQVFFRRSVNKLSGTINTTLGWVAQSMVSFSHWLSSIKTNTLSRYWTLVNANRASSNWALVVSDWCITRRLPKMHQPWVKFVIHQLLLCHLICLSYIQHSLVWMKIDFP